MPVPYMGSKRTSAAHIVALIKAYCPDVTELYDVFCGGFAVSEEAIRKGFAVHASDLNGSVVALINEVLFGECRDPKTGKSIFEAPRFIERDEFFESQGKSDWWSGYLQTCWSFGNNTRSYIFGENVVADKRARHKLVVDGEIQPEIKISERLQRKIIALPDWHKRRMALVKVSRLQQLQQLEQLEQLQRLEHKSYDEVEIKPGAVIYCDPPYAKTAGYKNAGDFDHVKFWSWAREKSKTNPVFVSEYNAPSDVRCIYEFSRRQLLSKGKTCNNERVFYLNNMEEKK